MSQRSNIEAIYNQHLKNGYSSTKAWDMAVSELGGNFGHYKLVNGEVKTTSAYETYLQKTETWQQTATRWLEDANKIRVANGLNPITEIPDGWIPEDETDSVLTADAKTSTSTTEELVVKDNSTVSSGGTTDTKTNYVVTDTSESLSLQSKVSTLKEKLNEIIHAKVKEGKVNELWDDPDVKQVSAELRAAELAQERAKKKTINKEDADGNVEVISHTEDITTGEVKNVVNTTSQNAGEVIEPVVGDDGSADGAPIDIEDESSAVSGVDKTGNTKRTTYNDDGTVKEYYDADGKLYSEEEINTMTTEEMIEAGIPIQQSKVLFPETINEHGEAVALHPEPSIAEMRQDKASSDDWRVRLRLAAQSDYLYNAPDPGILAPLTETDGIIFPYLPRFDTSHQARYSNYDLAHSNYRGYFYGGSHQERINVTSTFTAQDTKEANYLLASLHFLRSCTKMFYGQDMQRGTPPPLVFLSGLGDYQFNEHPCVIEMVNINLPNDVDYIKAGDTGTLSGDFMSPLSAPKSNLTPSFANVISSVARLFGSGLETGGKQAPSIVGANGSTAKASSGEITRVPTKLEIIFVLYPIQTRDQISNEYSLKDYASGSLLKKGFW